MAEAAPQTKAVQNNIPPPPFDLPLPDRPEIITSNVLKLNELTTDPRMKFIFDNLVTHIHKFVEETNITTDEWMSTIQFLTRTGQTCTPLRQEFILLSDVLGISALVDALNNPPEGKATESTVLGPFFTEDADDVAYGESIASEGKGQYLWVQGRVLDTEGHPIPDTVIETWETDENGFYDTQYSERDKPDCRGRVRTNKEGKFAYRAIVPVAYPIPGDGPVGELLYKLGRHNMRPNHLHMMFEAPGHHKLTTSLYPEGDVYLNSDAVFGVKKSLVVKLQTVSSEAEARAKGFAKGGSFKLLEHDFVLLTNEEAKAARDRVIQEKSANASK